MIVSAYNNNDKIVEGKLVTNKSGKKFVLSESKYVPVSTLKHVRFIEEEDQIDKQVKADIESLKKDLEKNPVKTDVLEKVADERTKELADGGIKEEEPGEYKTKFVLQADAIASGEDNGVDTSKTDPERSDTFDQNIRVKEAVESYENLHKDYQDVAPYEDDKTRDEIYQELNKEIEDSYKEDNKNEEELVEHLYKKFLNGLASPVKGQNLKESLKRLNHLICIARNC